MSHESHPCQTEQLGRTNPGITLLSLCGEPQGKSAGMEQLPTAGMSDYVLCCKNYNHTVLKCANRIKL